MRRFRHELDEGDIAGVEVGDPAKPVAAVWLHATGFNAMTYQSMLAPLGLRARIAALDLRGHGRTELPARPNKLRSWARYRDDVIEWMEQRAPQGALLAGHSMGGCVALMVAGKRPELVKGLVLADPVILSPRMYFWEHVCPPVVWLMRPGGQNLAVAARKRKNAFASAEDAKSSYEGRAIFKTWREPFLADYVLDGFERVDENPYDSEDQTWSLLCDPKWESATFRAQRNRPWQALSRVKKAKIPITVLMGEKGSVIAPRTAQRLMRKNPDLVMKIKQGTTHFLPMEAPYEVRDHMASYLARLVEGLTSADEVPIKRRLRTIGRR